MSAGRGWARRLLTFALIAVALGYIARMVLANAGDLATLELRIGMLALSVAAHVVVLVWGVFIWSRVLRFFAAEQASFPALLRIWALSNVVRYIPGGVWRFLAAARLANASGLSQVVTLSAMVVHVLLSLVSACVVAIATLPLDALGVSEDVALILRIAVPVAAVIAMHPAWLGWGLRLIPRALHREVLGWHGSWLDGLGLLCLSLATWAIYGGAFYLFLAALAPLPLSALPAAIGVNALSFVAGSVTVIAPGGLGVKEVAMTGLLLPLLPAGVAAVTAVAARLWSVVADLALAGIALLLRDRSATGEGDSPAV